jgi:hypothetical protein
MHGQKIILPDPVAHPLKMFSMARNSCDTNFIQIEDYLEVAWRVSSL